MPTPRHPRHPAPCPPHRHTTRAPTPTPQHTPPDRHAPPAHHTRPLHTRLTTPYLLPSILHLYICTSHPSLAARSDPILSTSQPSCYTPSHPLPHTFLPLFFEKICASLPKASSNPPVEIFYRKRRRTLILNTLPRQHHVDNSVNSPVYSG